MKLSIIFQPRLVDHGRAPNDLLFAEVNDENGNSISVGEWAADGEHESLTIDCAKFCRDNIQASRSKTATVMIPPGYKTAEAFTKDCDLELAPDQDYKHGALYVYDATSQTFDPPAIDYAKHLKQLDDVTAIAVSPGNAGASEYMRGMANGLILAQSVFTDKEPEYINPTEKFVIPEPPSPEYEHDKLYVYDATSQTFDPSASKVISESDITELYHYASSYETFDENTPNGKQCQHGGNPMDDARRAAIVAYKKVLGLLPKDYQP